MQEKKTQLPDTHERHMEVTLSIGKIITGVITTLIIGAILGSFTLVRTSDSLVYRVLAVELESDEIKKHLVPRSEYDLTVKHIDEKLFNIEKKLDNILDKM